MEDYEFGHISVKSETDKQLDDQKSKDRELKEGDSTEKIKEGN